MGLESESEEFILIPLRFTNLSLYIFLLTIFFIDSKYQVLQILQDFSLVDFLSNYCILGTVSLEEFYCMY